MSRFFKESFVLTKDEISSVDSSRNDRGSGGGRRALTRTTVISSTQGRVAHPGANRRTKRIVRFVAERDGLGPLWTEELAEFAVSNFLT